MLVLALGAAGLGTALAVIGVTFLLALRRGRYDLVDSAWGAGFAAIAVVAVLVAGMSTVPGVVACALTVIWGLRLSVHIHRRNRGKPEDPRYRDILARARGNPAVHMFLRVYLAQAVVMWVVSWPVLLALYAADSGFTVLAWLGVAVWIFGFLFEAIGDEQLRRFKADPANAGAVLDRGLWRYTRHPNYFGDACVWWGLYLLACHHPLGAVTVFSPILMTWLLARGTGKPLLERQLRETRPRYAEYVERTSGFVPLPPRRP
ncbi:DUF1295 domain-containing protein [Amycolatopsis aidingensis]|uniref:DUF1295 domain-containing protein n=1 Tax=Amycolatopsis aidingensis TaxID=2842453 RepID=UPI001C0D0C07|nr:DUF1295 domain-containing protein [Amycolatopsis aidingensis]